MTQAPRDLLEAAPCIDFDALEAAALQCDPFRFIVVPNVLRSERLRMLLEDFPDISGPGSFPIKSLHVGASFKQLLDALQGQRFRAALSRKFEIDLAERPALVTLRGMARLSDGGVHTDTSSKLISVLLYMNQDWPADGGRLRLLRSMSLEDSAVEIPPLAGSLVAFQRSEVSWHGHRPHAGTRRVIQLNYLTDQSIALRERRRHVVTSAWKKMSRYFTGN